ncbi:MAG: ribonuclease HII [Thermoplasmata archaeon]|nr:ribonuclease HII [Euryarchaeota archaeon]RLF65221.1 MAG: ribonuclease HII [Thermoplasmata archaeon]
MEAIAGIDEAGRGPVLGPMIVVGVEAPEIVLKRFKLKDSKEYSRITRDNLAMSLLKIIERIHVRVLYPEVIDYFVENYTINELELLIYLSITHDINAKTIYIDCFSTNVEDIRSVFRRNFPEKLFIIEHKADKKYPIVSAASIIAKYMRDLIMDSLSETLGIPLGSGYPSDPRTIDFLKKHFSQGNRNTLKGVIRFSWKTVKRLLPKRKTLFDSW